MARFAILAYGVVSYLIGLSAIVYAIGFIGNFVPKSIDQGGPPTDFNTAVLVNLALLAVFAVQHSGMARPAFKASWTRVIPHAMERSTYVLLAGLVLALLFWQWRPIDGIVWSTTGAPAMALWAVFWLGWAVLFISTFLINHFDLFGLAQVWAVWRGIKPSPMEFRTPFFYRVVRHPIYVGFLLIVWGAPTMTMGHLLFSAGCTGYILLGIWLEERDLIAVFGDTYRDYRARVSMLIPLPPRRG